LRRFVKPRDSASSLDPWELAYEALGELHKFEPVFRAHGVRAEQIGRLEAIAEALRRLA
jgi:hypothetical protein